MSFVYLQIPGVPIMYITQHKYSIERMPEATIGGGKLYAVKHFAFENSLPGDRFKLVSFIIQQQDAFVIFLK